MKKLIGTSAIALLVAGGAVLATPLAAQAHTGDMNVTAVCNTETGEYDFTVKLSTANSPLAWTTKWRVGTESFQGTPNNDAGMDRGPLTGTGPQTITLGTFSLPGTTTGKGPWVYAHTTWSDNYRQGSDGQLLTSLKGDCVVPIPEQPDPLSGSEDRQSEPVCVEPLNGNATVLYESREWTQEPVWSEETRAWEFGEKQFTEWEFVKNEQVEDETCAPPATTPPPGEKLANTGGSDLLLPLGVAALFGLAGLGFALMARRRE